MDGNYQVIAPLVAQDAGLGEIGRSSLLITKNYGPRVRLGVVTTNMPLICDEKATFGIKTFCEMCGKCAKTCPSKAIPKGDPIKTNDDSKWLIDADACYKRWRQLGTDCGVCLASCPFSDGVPETLVDKMMDSKAIRAAIIKRHEEKYKTRGYVKEKPEWLV